MNNTVIIKLKTNSERGYFILFYFIERGYFKTGK